MFVMDGTGPGKEFRTQSAGDAKTILHILQGGDTKQVRLVGQYLIAQVDVDKIVNPYNERNVKNEFNWQTYYGKSVNLKYSMSPEPHVSIVVEI